MALEAIVEEIHRKGDEQARAIKEKSQKQADKIISEAKDKAEEILRKARAEAETEAERLKKQEISSVNLEMKRSLLNKKKEIIEEVFELAKEKVSSMDAGEKKKLLNALISKNAVENSVVYSSKEDESLVKEILPKGVSYGGTIDCIGGVIIESSDGILRLNLTFDEMLNQLFDQKMGEVSKTLFGE